MVLVKCQLALAPLPLKVLAGIPLAAMDGLTESALCFSHLTLLTPAET